LHRRGLSVISVAVEKSATLWAFFIGSAQRPNGAPVDFRLAPAYKSARA
jgi:hypothetical protein